MSFLFFFNDTATTEIYTLSLHDALPICDERVDWRRPGVGGRRGAGRRDGARHRRRGDRFGHCEPCVAARARRRERDRKSTRLNSSHANISYAVFCLNKKINTVETKSAI